MTMRLLNVRRESVCSRTYEAFRPKQDPNRSCESTGRERDQPATLLTRELLAKQTTRQCSKYAREEGWFDLEE
jgi:hypothetical protein